MSVIIEVTTTCSCQESARQLATEIMQSQLAACVQISGPIESIYRWEGVQHQDAEWICTIKSVPHMQSQLVEFLVQHHAYDVPQILVAKVEASAAYAAWVENEVRN